MDSEHMLRLAALLKDSASALELAAEWQSQFCVDYMPISENANVDSKTLSTHIEDLGLSQRVKNCLYTKDIDTIQKILRTRVERLLEIKNFGPKCLVELRQKIINCGLKLKGDFYKYDA